MTFYQSQDLPGLWVDAFVTDDLQKLLFFSAWGNESHVQQLRARLSLPGNDMQALRSFRLQGNPEQILIGEKDRLTSLIGRPAHSPFVSLTHVWVFDHLIVEPNAKSLNALVLARQAEPFDELRLRIWRAVMQLSPVPLLFEWITLFDEFCEQGFIKKQTGHAVDAYAISLNESSLSQLIQEKLHQHALPLPF
ncbi:MAG: hypothetical protein K0R24_1000 [Gammaproteobacteria bacterium]|jgi:hypothetical protein|nr:hypothetical protein [Gammaproteobacteria bacterium]